MKNIKIEIKNLMKGHNSTLDRTVKRTSEMVKLKTVEKSLEKQRYRKYKNNRE